MIRLLSSSWPAVATQMRRVISQARHLKVYLHQLTFLLQCPCHFTHLRRVVLSSVQRLRQHSIGCLGDRSTDATNNIKVLKKKKATKVNPEKQTTQNKATQTHRKRTVNVNPLVYTNMRWLGDGSHRGQGWVNEQCFTSPPTQYRLYGKQFLQVKRPNPQYQSTEGRSTKEKENNENN